MFSPRSLCGPALLASFSAAGLSPAQSCLWSEVRGNPGPSGSFRAIFDPAGARTLLVGQRAFVMELWSWNSQSWTLLASGGPSVRSDYGLAYDSTRARLVLYGGFDSYPSGFLNDTWEWDGAAWAFRTGSGPGARSGHVMAFDSVRARTVLFSGNRPGFRESDTWEWDGIRWTPVSLIGPPPRASAAMSFDSARARMVLFGGYGLSDTWEWDGQTWMLRATAGPSGRSGAAMVFDPSRQRTLLFGGFPDNYFIHDTWEYDGVPGDWTLRLAGAPVLTAAAPLAFDTSRGVGILFANPTTRWEWRGSAAGIPAWVAQHPEYQRAILGAAATIEVTAEGTAPISYRWRRGGIPLSNGGNISGADAPTLRIDPVTLADFGSYDVTVSNSCGQMTSNQAFLGLLSQCYPNCDSSYTPPFLNVSDFGCFLDMFAAGYSYANCDGSIAPPALTVYDMLCFLNAFAAGCSVP